MKPDETHSALIVKIVELRPASTRDPQAAARGRARFLAEASQLREAASVRKDQRLNIWNLIFRKELPVMKIATSALILILLFASVTTTVAAQNDLPTEPLYGVKIFSEDARLWLASDTPAKIDHLMEFAQVRTEEMTALTKQGSDIPARVTERLHQHIEIALQLAASQNDQQMHTSLLTIQVQLQTQEHVMTQLQTQATGTGQAILERARIRTREQLRVANEGLVDPFTFRNRFRHQNSFGQPTPTLTGVPPESATPQGSGNGPGPHAQGTAVPNCTTCGGYGLGPNATATPGAGYGPGPNPSATAGGGGYGPGPNATATPGAGYGPGPNPTATGGGYNPGPNPTVTQGGGSGPGPNPTITPGEGTGTGPNPTPTPGGGNGPGPNPTNTPNEGGGGGGGGGGTP